MFTRFSNGLLLGVAVVVSQLAFAPAVSAAGKLKVSVGTVKSGGMLPNKYAFCQPAAKGHSGPGPNISPAVKWSKGPKGTQSYVVILNDTDSPKTNRDKMNKEGMTVPATSERQMFYHWVLVDIPAKVTSLKEGAASKARVLHGKPATPAPAGGVNGLNDYTKVTAANDAMKGQYFGYDGPCPPWNDENMHHYRFFVYALNVKSLKLPKQFYGPDVMDAMKGKVLAEGKFESVYTQDPAKGAKVSK